MLQAWLLWAFILILALVLIAGGCQSVAWLLGQHGSTPSAYFSLALVALVWAIQQFINFLLMPLLNIRKFNGASSSLLRLSLFARHILCMLCQAVVRPELLAAPHYRLFFHVLVPSPALLCCLHPHTLYRALQVYWKHVLFFVWLLQGQLICPMPSRHFPLRFRHVRRAALGVPTTSGC